ncbi:uncharacterized protein LOC142522554 [Primulina tabacum]|uniref:uncharacterized protein LOC142522554 n=1 Tax=Primulina tabacum TaxID=48773 RepID=UPI003F59F4ED
MVGAPISYSGHYPAAAGGADQTQASPYQMYATPNSPISTLLPYNGLPPHAASFIPSSAPINTSYLYPPTYPPNPSLASPPPTYTPANLYHPPFPNYPLTPVQSQPPPALTGYPPQQLGALNLHNQAPSAYPFSVQPTGTYPPPSSTAQYYPPNNSIAQPGIYQSQPANPGVYPPPRH